MTPCGVSAPPRTLRSLRGVDFTSNPSRRKPIVMAEGVLSDDDGTVTLLQLHRFDTLPACTAALRSPSAWIGAFDLPFGLPRLLVEQLGWPTEWHACLQHYAALSRAEIRRLFMQFCAARPAGGKFAHRACDTPAGSSPSMKWVNPPVAWMLHAGVPMLLEAGVDLPSLHPGDPNRVALEGYPGLLARELIGRVSYKSDTRVQQTFERRAARELLLQRLEAGQTRLGLTLKLSAPLRDALCTDPSADCLDATLCLIQAGWAAQRPGYGLPADVDPLEGWILTANAD